MSRSLKYDKNYIEDVETFFQENDNERNIQTEQEINNDCIEYAAFDIKNAISNYCNKNGCNIAESITCEMVENLLYKIVGKSD